MKILIVGSGGREHTLAWKFHRDDEHNELFACPGNGGTRELAGNFPLSDRQIRDIARYAADKKVDLTVVGPETPLSLGIVDLFTEAGLKVFGPTQQGARLESSKCFSKEFMRRNGVPTAAFSVASSLQEAISIVEHHSLPFVLKFDGLAAGKGVRIVQSFEEGLTFLEDIFVRRIFGGDNPMVLIEQCLSGVEMSYLVMTDGVTAVPLAPAQDYKRIGDSDIGPNTGGMGSYCPSAFLTEELRRLIDARIVAPTLRGLQKEGIVFKGVIYFGLMLTTEGPSVLEYNVRFGDPETQVIIPRLSSNLAEAMEAVIAGEAHRVTLRWDERSAVCIVLASRGYPGSYEINKAISGADRCPQALIFHAGTKMDGETLCTAGGRVMGITALGADLADARRKAYAAAEAVQFEGKYYRKDIALLEKESPI